MNMGCNKENIFLKTTLKNKKGGVALILVVSILVILITIVGEFSYSMRTELNIMRNFKEEEGAYQLARAGIERAKIEILSANDSTYLYLNEDGILVFGEEDENPLREDKIGSGTFSYTITDEDGKLNINSASIPQLRYVIKKTGVDMNDADTIVDSIIDWRDTNDFHMLNGAEEDYYQSLVTPYSCKDAPFDIIDELLLVKGVTHEIFFGSDVEEEREYEGVVQYLTPWGSGKINLNTAPEIVLETVFGSTAAANIISQREISPIFYPTKGGIVMSSFFIVTSTGTIGESKIKRTIKTILEKKEGKIETVYWNDNFI